MIGLGFGLGDDLLCPALKVLVDGCRNPLRCGGCAVEWGSVEGVVSSSAHGVVSIEVDLECWIGTSGREVGVLRFLVFGASRNCAGLSWVSVSVRVGGGIVTHLSVCMDSLFLLHGSLLMVEALCDVGGNWTAHGW